VTAKRAKQMFANEQKKKDDTYLSSLNEFLDGNLKAMAEIITLKRVTEENIEKESRILTNTKMEISK
jgi:hypothetical protein